MKAHGWMVLALSLTGSTAALACAPEAFSVALGEALRRKGLRPSLHHAEPIKGENRPLLDPARGVYQFDGLAVLRHADIPAVLLEAGVIVNPDEERLLDTPTHRQAIADSVVETAGVVCSADT